MYDLERLQEAYNHPSNDRQTDKTTMNIFNLLGYIDILNVENIIVYIKQYNLSHAFALRFDTVLEEMGFEYDVSCSINFKFTVKDCNGNNKKVNIITTYIDPIDDVLTSHPLFRGSRHALYYIDSNRIDECYLDLSKSGIPSEDDDYSPLIKA